MINIQADERLALVGLTERWAAMLATQASSSDWLEQDRAIRDVMSYVAGWADCSYVSGDRESTDLFCWVSELVTTEFFIPHTDRLGDASDTIQ